MAPGISQADGKHRNRWDCGPVGESPDSPAATGSPASPSPISKCGRLIGRMHGSVADLERRSRGTGRMSGEGGASEEGKKKVAVTPSFPIFLSSALHPLTVLLLFRALQQLFARDTGQSCPLQLLVLCASAARPSTKNPISRVRPPSLSNCVAPPCATLN